MRVPVVSKAESWRRKRTRVLRRLQEGAREFLYFFSPWRKALQLIGGEPAGGFVFFLAVRLNRRFQTPAGNFGGGVQSFFVLLRFLVLLNFFSFLLIGGFVLIPSIVFSSEGGNSSVNIPGNQTDPTLVSKATVFRN